MYYVTRTAQLSIFSMEGKKYMNKLINQYFVTLKKIRNETRKTDSSTIDRITDLILSSTSEFILIN